MTETKGNRRVPGSEFAALMERYGIRTAKGARLAAQILHMRGERSIYGIYRNQMLRTEFELMEIKLAALRAEGKI